MSVPQRREDETGITFQTAAPLFAASPALEIVLWNAGAEALLGFAAGDVLGKRCYDVLGCPHSTRCRCARSGGEGEDAGPGERAPVFENEVATKSGERVCLSVTTILATSRDDVPLRLHVLQELKRQRQLEELLRRVVSTASSLPPPAEARDAAATRSAPFLRGITRREREVVRLLARGTSTADIAAGLGITPRTARNHIQNILCKLHVHSRLEAVAYASARGLL